MCWMLESWCAEAREKIIIVLKPVESKVWAQLGSLTTACADSVGVFEMDICSDWKLGEWRIRIKGVMAKDIKGEALNRHEIVFRLQRWFWSISGAIWAEALSSSWIRKTDQKSKWKCLNCINLRSLPLFGGAADACCPVLKKIGTNGKKWLLFLCLWAWPGVR